MFESGQNKIYVCFRPVRSESSLCAQWVVEDPCGQRRHWSDWADAQADLSLRWGHMAFCWFCHEAAQIQTVCVRVWTIIGESIKEALTQSGTQWTVATPEEDRTSIQMSRNMTKPTKWPVCQAKTRINLGIRPVWAESSLSACRKLGSFATHWAYSEYTDHTGRMPRLISVFGGRAVFCWFCHEAAQMVSSEYWVYVTDLKEREKNLCLGTETFARIAFLCIWFFCLKGHTKQD